MTVHEELLAVIEEIERREGIQVRQIMVLGEPGSERRVEVVSDWVSS